MNLGKLNLFYCICHKAVTVAVSSALSKEVLNFLNMALTASSRKWKIMFHGAHQTIQTQDVNVIDDVRQKTLKTSCICFNGFEFAAR